MDTLSSIYILLVAVSLSVLQVDGEEYHFKCEAESGCNIAQSCNPIADKFLFIEDFDPSILQSKSDYHLICKSSVTDVVVSGIEPDTDWLLEQDFRCKPKPSCNFSSCNPVPDLFLNIQSFNPELYKKNNDYPVLCTTKPASHHVSRGAENTIDARLQDVSYKELHCRPVPWCDMSKCDPVPHGLSASAATTYRRSSAYYISCKAKVDHIDEGAEEKAGPDNKVSSVESDIEIILKQNNAKLMERMDEKLEAFEDDIGIKFRSIVDEKLAAMENQFQDLSGRINENSKDVKKSHDKYKKLKDLATEVIDQMEDLKAEISGVDAKSTYQTKDKDDPYAKLCQIEDEGSCFWAALGEKMDFADAGELCKMNRSKVAMITSESQFEKLLLYIRNEIDTDNGILHMWLGMLSKEKDRPSSGFYFYWYPGAPYLSPKSTHTALKVSMDDSPYQGMYNADPKWKKEGVICQYEERRGS